MTAAEDDRIADHERLWRRIHPTHYQDTGGGFRVVSAAFKTTDLCFDRVEILDGRGLGVAFTAAGGVGVGELLAASLRSKLLEPVPEPEEGNPAHAVVEGTISRRHAQELSSECRFLPVD